MGADSLSARRFHSETSEMLASGFIGGSGTLFRLERVARACHRDLQGDERIVCAGVAEMLGRIAKRQDGAAVTADESASLCSMISQPLTRCIDFLVGKDSGVSAALLLGDLTNAYSRWQTQQSSE
jgi:hypothetical protein